MSHPVDGENNEAMQPRSPENGERPPGGTPTESDATSSEPGSVPDAESPEQAVSDAIGEAAAIADATPPPGGSIADLTAADLPEPQIPEPVIPEPEIPAADIPEPVIPEPEIPEPEASASDVAVPATRAQRRSLPSVDSLPEPAPIPRDPAVVPPASGATTGGYRAWTIAIFVLLVVLLIAAVATVVVLATAGPALFSAEAVTVADRAFGGSPA